MEAISAIRVGTACVLERAFGPGPWARVDVLKTLDVAPRRAVVRVGWLHGDVVCALRLQTKKPWAIDASHFTPVRRPLYLVGMVVAAPLQRRGVGRAALRDAMDVAGRWPADAIRLDAWDAPPGAGPFYERCGFRACGRANFRGAPLVYYESVLTLRVVSG